MMIEAILVGIACLLVGYWLGSPTEIEVERHDHEHNSVDSVEYMTVAGCSGGGASGGRVRIEQIDAEQVTPTQERQ